MQPRYKVIVVMAVLMSLGVAAAPQKSSNPPPDNNPSTDGMQIKSSLQSSFASQSLPPASHGDPGWHFGGTIEFVLVGVVGVVVVVEGVLNEHAKKL